MYGIYGLSGVESYASNYLSDSLKSGWGKAFYDSAICNTILAVAVLFENYAFDAVDRMLERFVNPRNTMGRRGSTQKKIALLSGLVMTIGVLQVAVSFNPALTTTLTVAENLLMSAII